MAGTTFTLQVSKHQSNSIWKQSSRCGKAHLILSRNLFTKKVKLHCLSSGFNIPKLCPLVLHPCEAGGLVDLFLLG